MDAAIRETLEKRETEYLSDKAAKSAFTKGRNTPEAPCPLRTEYQRDRDRIIHCKAFRRLKHKTQVFLSPMGDHYRTRLTHTLEVSQIARTIARALFLNEDLTEAIALGHDLGHTPFGHAGERALNRCCPMGFRHYEQSVRVVEHLEKNHVGLNLTAEVKDGILCHTSGGQAITLEGRIVRLADRIAYLNHDFDDAVRAGILSESELPETITNKLGVSGSGRINTLVLSAVACSGEEIALDNEIQQAFALLYDFMFERVYRNKKAKGEEVKVESLIESMYRYFTARPDKLPEEYRFISEHEGVTRAVLDYIAGMTDRYAAEVFKELFVPRSWSF